MKSNLQIISGKFRGRKLFLPGDARPTQNRARAAIFNILNSGIINFADNSFRVWDAFAGSGAVGVEFLSRFENASVVFTDSSSESINAIKRNTQDFKNAKIVNTDSISVINKYGCDADIIFVDPPYADAGLGIVFIRKLINVLKSGAIVVWEMEKSFDFELKNEAVKILKDKTYGRARFVIFSKL